MIYLYLSFSGSLICFWKHHLIISFLLNEVCLSSGGQRSHSCLVSHPKTRFAPESSKKTRFCRSLCSQSRATQTVWNKSLTSAAAAPLIHRSDVISSDRSDRKLIERKCSMITQFVPQFSTRDSNSTNCCWERKKHEEFRLRCVQGPAKSTEFRKRKLQWIFIFYHGAATILMEDQLKQHL